MLAGSPEDASKACESLRRALSHTPVTVDVAAAAAAVLRVLERYPSQLRVAHLCVAVLAHPALNAALVSPPSAFDDAVLRALERLAISAAFVHTALAALQNSASSAAPAPRDPVLAAVVAAMHQHSAHTGILLRAADLIAFHLNQPVLPPPTATFDMCARAVISAAPRLAASPQGASAGLLALVACARHSAAMQLATTRFVRGSHGHSNCIVDSAFANMVVAAMNRHKEFAPVQVLSAELVRVAAAGASNAAKTAAREFFAVNAHNGLLIAIHVHHADDTVVERSLAGLRSLLLLGSTGSQARAVKPTVVLSPNIADAVVQVTEQAATALSARNPDIAALARALASDIRIAASIASSSSLSASSAAAAAASGAGGKGPSGASRSTRERSFSVVAFGRRFARSLRMNRSSRVDNTSPTTSRLHYHGHRAEKPYASGHVLGASAAMTNGGSGLGFANSATLARTDIGWHDKDSASLKLYGGVARAHQPPAAGASSSLVSNRSATSTEPAFTQNRPKSANVDRGDPADRASGDLRTAAANTRWRSVGGRWRSRSTRGTAAACPPRPARHQRSPLALSGSEVANLSRQPSQLRFADPDLTVVPAVRTGA